MRSNITNAIGTEKHVVSYQLEEIAHHIKLDKLIVLTGSNEQHNMALVSTLIHQLVFRQGLTCAVYCQDATEFTIGQLAHVSEVGIEKLNTGKLNDDDWRKFAHSLGVAEGAPLFLAQSVASFDLLLESIRSHAGRCKKGSAVFVFDLHRLLGTVGLAGNDQMPPLARALHELRELSVETGLPIIVIHHSSEKDAQGEFENISQFADAVFLLEMLADENSIVNPLI